MELLALVSPTMRAEIRQHQYQAALLEMEWLCDVVCPDGDVGVHTEAHRKTVLNVCGPYSSTRLVPFPPYNRVPKGTMCSAGIIRAFDYCPGDIVSAANT